MSNIDLIKTDRVNNLDNVIKNINVTIVDNNSAFNRELSNLSESVDARIESLDTKIDTNTESLRELINTINTTLTTTISDVLQKKVYPVGSLYITLNNTNPSTVLGFGTWTQVGSGRVLQGADTNHSAGTTIEPGLPNISGKVVCLRNDANKSWATGAFYNDNTATASNGAGSTANTITSVAMDASRQNKIYGNSTTVQPPAYCVIIWRRTA